MLKIVEKKKIWFCISLAVIIIGIGFMLFKGLNFGIDFKGGTKVILAYEDGFNKEEADKIVKEYIVDAVTNTIGENQYEIKSSKLDSDALEKAFEDLKENESVTEMVSEEAVGASVGSDLTKTSIIALSVAFIAMLAYIAFRFEFRFGIAALMALMHDVLITLSIYAVFNVTINTPFIAAILTIIGYSINATIVIFDRIRENSKGLRRSNVEEVVNKSISQTMARSINTTITTLFTIGAVLLFVPSVRMFSFPITVGILTGTYSSIFIAPSLYCVIKNKFSGKKKVSVAK